MAELWCVAVTDAARTMRHAAPVGVRKIEFG